MCLYPFLVLVASLNHTINDIYEAVSIHICLTTTIAQMNLK